MEGEMTDLPQWAVEKAEEIIRAWALLTSCNEDRWPEFIARALVEAAEQPAAPEVKG